MNEKSFEECRKKTSELLKITKDNIFEKSIEFLTLQILYHDTYIKEFKIFKDLSLEKDKFYSQLYTDNKTNNNLQLKNKSEVENYIFQNNLYYDKCIELNKQEAVVKYLEGIVDYLKQTSFSIKNIIELKRMKGE
jgi:hypothetical protein